MDSNQRYLTVTDLQSGAIATMRHSRVLRHEVFQRTTQTRMT